MVKVSHSDDGVNYTPYFVGFDPATKPASWHTFNAPYVDGITANTPNSHCGIEITTSQSGNRWSGMRVNSYYAGGVEQVGPTAGAVASYETSTHTGSASFKASRLLVNDTNRWVSMDATGLALQGVFFEMATPAVIDRVDITSTQYNNNMPKDFSLLVGNGKTFVSALDRVGEPAWGTGELRQYNV
jgi:hypothetical protein